MQQSITIEKTPSLNGSSDFALLRQKGLEYIQQLGNKLWTDYNIHDPGITILEALCYAITDLGYRTSFDIKDLLADPPNATPDYKRQAFYTAREILTVNPWTINDFRKLLIDIDGIKNGWMYCRLCPCDDIYIYANCEKSILQYEPTDYPVIIKGMYDVLVEFEDEEGTGNLNSGKIKYNFSYPAGTGHTTAEIEIRLPSWFVLEESKALYKDFRNPLSVITNVAVDFISGNKTDNNDIPANELATRLRRPVYASHITVTYQPDKNNPATTNLIFEDTPLTIWFHSDEDRRNLKDLQYVKAAIQDATQSGIMPKYLEKIKKADDVIAITTQVLHSHRNLCEDYCSIKAVEVEDIAVCADMEVEPAADIEAVIAEAYYLIDQYFSPDIKFYSLKQLMDEGKVVDDIFEGPALNNGFIDNVQLESTNLKKVLYTSDILNLLMDIKGVVSIKNFQLVRYNEEGILVESQPWSMQVSLNHQPRLYTEASKILVFKNGLPFLPDRLELSDTLQVIKGQHAQPKYPVADNDLPVPKGTYYDLNEYYPVQYSLPLTYGTGFEGLPSTATQKRIAQAKQLKAYLLFFEQLLVNYLEQLSHIKDLFAVDNTVAHSYFSRFITSNEIVGANQIYNGLDAAALEKLDETQPVFLDRRNRFLDHLLARFAESFNDYALMLYSYIDDKAIADEQLIKDKISFLKAFPFMSANRGRALNVKDQTHVCNTENIAGLQKRIELLLKLDTEGYLNYFELYEEKDKDGKVYERRWRLIDENDKIYLSSSTNYFDVDFSKAQDKAKQEISEVFKYITDASKYEIKKEKKWIVNLLNEEGKIIATRKQAFNTKTMALAARDEIIAFGEKIAAIEKLFIVEHVLLRPRNKKSFALYFELYEEKDTDGNFFERRWRLIDAERNIYLSSSTRYPDPDLSVATEKAKNEINAVCQFITDPASYQVKKEIRWVLNLLDNTGEVIATRKEHFDSQAEAEAARDEIIQLVEIFSAGGNIINADHMLVTSETEFNESIAQGDPLLPVCLPGNCVFCGEEDPYSFRLTIVINGEDGPAGTDMDFRRFAEQTIRLETPAHLGVKICWVSKKQLLDFAAVYCAWRTELAKPEPDPDELHNRLIDLLNVFNDLKNIYPPATLHDCIDGNDENRVYLNNTII
jgi:hypothetical protein